jgi:ABC-2 type transport system ATP-binding protein
MDPGPPNTLFDVANLTKRYGRLQALKGVSFTVRAGEVLGLIGPNGSGKTTLFECLGGVLPYDVGAIRRDSRALTTRERHELLFYLPDGITPWPSQPVGWVLDFARGFFGGRPLNNDVIRRLDLDELLRVPMAALSKGQRKRALLAVGLHVPQPVLLADEPFDGLDLRQTREVADLLRGEAGSGRTLFLSIHQINEAARVCDRFVLLSGGRVCGEGTADELSRIAGSRGASNRDLEQVFLALT